MLADVAGAGPFFVVDTDPAAPADPGRHPVGEVYGGDPVLAARIAHVRRALGSDDRVAASITFQGLAALLVSAPFAAVVVHGVLPELTRQTLHWTPSTEGPWTQWCPDPPARAVPDLDDAAAAVVAAVLHGHLAPLVAAVRGQVSVSERVLWGNAAATVASARRLVVARWPGSAARAAALAHRILDAEVVRDLGEFGSPRPPDTAWTFRRRTCCLYYRAGGGLCGDCVLTPRPG